MLSKIKAYWQSKQSSIHGLIVFLGGASGLAAMKLLHLPDGVAQEISGACMVIGALMVTP